MKRGHVFKNHHWIFRTKWPPNKGHISMSFQGWPLFTGLNVHKCVCQIYFLWRHFLPGKCRAQSVAPTHCLDLIYLYKIKLFEQYSLQFIRILIYFFFRIRYHLRSAIIAYYHNLFRKSTICFIQYNCILRIMYH